MADAPRKEQAPPQPQQAPPQQQQAPQYHFVDLPNMPETFADSIQTVFFDGQTLRVDFCVSRVDELKAGSITGHRYPSCRLVLTATAAVDLINRMQQIGATLTQAGVIKVTPRPAPPAKTE